MSRSNIIIIQLSFIFFLFFLNFITTRAKPIKTPIKFSKFISNSSSPIDNPHSFPTNNQQNDIYEKYADLLVREKELEEKYQKLLKEYQQNAVQIQINKIYFKALFITIIILIIILLIAVIFKIFKICFTNNISSELLIKSISKKLINQKKHNENKITQNNNSVSCYNLFDSNMNINESQINENPFSSNDKNYDAPAMAILKKNIKGEGDIENEYKKNQESKI